MNKLNFAFGIHNHQPVGNFDHVFESAYNDSYKPFLDTLERHPNFRMALHCTGILMEWFENNHPDIIDQIARLAEQNQIEIMTGGFYEPILPTIPDEDKIGQIRKLSDYITRRFGVTPRGMWVAERVWEPQLPRPLREAGVEYVVLDDSHFKCSGLAEHQTFGYYITEDMGYSVAAFPINSNLRYTIPFHDLDETIDYMYHVAAAEENRCLVFADDGEKFGVWPGTHKHCYEDGWLDRFMSAVEKQSDWIEMITFSEALDRMNPQGPVYLPTASYFEMMQWAMPPAAIRQHQTFVDQLNQHNLFDGNQPFVRAGFWRNFLAKYEEANHIHKRMICLSEKVSQRSGGKESKKLKDARNYLWRGQCNCAYWHGVFGGLYLPHLRHALFENMIQADALINSLDHPKKTWIDVTEEDFNADNFDEIIVSTSEQILFFSPLVGASIIEHDYIPAKTNLTNSLRRRDEAYHDKILHSGEAEADGSASIHEMVAAKESGLDKFVYHDAYRRASLIDHFFDPGTEVEALRTNDYEERGDFLYSPFDYQIARTQKSVTINFSREGQVYGNPVFISKAVTLHSDSAKSHIQYTIENRSEHEIAAIFGVEFNISLLAGNAADRYYFIAGRPLQQPHLASLGEVTGTEIFGVKDHWLDIRVMWEFEQPIRFWRYPVETVSLSEGGFERIYQSSCLLPNMDLNLPPGKSIDFSFSLETARAGD